MVEKVLAIVPARGGSKRLPSKNLIEVQGLPLLAHTIRQARAAHSIAAVYVSTDDDRIAAVAREHGAEVIERPASLATDRSSSESAMLHALDAIEAREGSLTGATMMLQCTSPLRARDDMDNAVRQFFDEGADSLLSACRTKHFIWRRSPETASPVNYDHARRPRSQDFEPQFAENGSIYITRTDLLRATGNRLGGKIAVYEMSPWCAYEIDDRDDLALIEWIMRRQIV